jgi:thiol-disulfide isomerase/thioredoxin
MNDAVPPQSRALGRRSIVGAAAVVLVLGAAAAGLYGTGYLGSNRGGDCAPAAATLARLAPLATGEVAAFQVAAKPEAAPPLAFDAPGGSRRTIADFRGRAILLNLWATWCEPCRREMPALDGLQAELGGPAFEVVTVNIDTRNLDRPKTWLANAGVTRLAYYSDKEAKIFQDLRRVGQAEGMPTTLLIDGRGCRLGTMAGPAEWSSPQGLALVRAAIGS